MAKALLVCNPEQVHAKFAAYHNGNAYTPEQWESKWRLWLLRERETRSQRQTKDTKSARSPGSFLQSTPSTDLTADYEVLADGR